MIVGGGDNQLMSEINVTPFVDVMLVLLIIFMVAAPMMTQGVDVALPEVKAESLPQDDEVPFVVSVDKAGKVFINEFEVEKSQLNAKLLAIFKQKPTEKVFLRADKRVPYGTVMDVMAQIRGAGIEKLGMITEPASEKKI
jgi:biopolymer transport protein TolR